MPERLVLAYCREGRVYLNLTNRCPTACSFCVKRAWDWKFGAIDLRLGSREPSLEESWTAAKALLGREADPELVFCGYGESTVRLPEVLELGRRAKRDFPAARRRLNTIGLGDLLWGRDIVPELARRLDAVSVSLNTADPDQWQGLHRPKPQYRRQGFGAVCRFIEDCVSAGLVTTVTAIDRPDVDLAAVEALARGLGARFRLRPELVREGAA